MLLIICACRWVPGTSQVSDHVANTRHRHHNDSTRRGSVDVVAADG